MGILHLYIDQYLILTLIASIPEEKSSSSRTKDSKGKKNVAGEDLLSDLKKN